MLLESSEVPKDDRDVDSGLEVLVFGADVNSDEACAQRSKRLVLLLTPAVTDYSCMLPY